MLGIDHQAETWRRRVLTVALALGSLVMLAACEDFLPRTEQQSPRMPEGTIRSGLPTRVPVYVDPAVPSPLAFSLWQGIEASGMPIVPVASSSRAALSLHVGQSKGAEVVGTLTYLPVANFFSPLDGITRSDLAAIARGGITDWRRLGWPVTSTLPLHLMTMEGTDLRSLLGVTVTVPISTYASADRLAEALWQDPGGLAIIPAVAITVSMHILALDGIDPLRGTGNAGSYPLTLPLSLSITPGVPSSLVQDLRRTAASLAPTDPIIDVAMVGDIVPGRTVHKRMQQYGYAAPFSRTAADLRAADITVGNLEGVLSDVYAPPKDPHTLTFVSSLKAIDGYLTAGFDALSLANNHAGNAGPGPLTETLAALKKKGILPFGAGLQRREAHSPAIITAKGVRFAFLGYEDVFRHLGYPGLWVATDTKPGTADLGDGNEAVRDIWAAHRQADVVVVFPHWGVEYTAVPTQRQREMARRFIDAGADAVVGAHPHWVQAVEFYKGRPIVYSLGNFVFDQMFSIETRQGIVLHMRWSGKHLISLTMKPILIEDYYQPRFIPTSQGWAILARMMNATRALMRQDATSPLPSR